MLVKLWLTNAKTHKWAGEVDKIIMEVNGGSIQLHANEFIKLPQLLMV